MIHAFLAAAISTAAAKPLFVPSKGMASISADANVRMGLLQQARDARFVREYRGYVKIKPSWSNVTYKVPETIVILAYPTNVNASEWGANALDREERVMHAPPQMIAWCAQRGHHCGELKTDVVKRISAQPIALCNGQRGWLNAFTRGNDTYEAVFARSGNRMYSAALRFQTDAGDTFHAAWSLRTLCPKGVGELEAPAVAVPFTAPPRWMRSTDTSSPYPDFQLLGAWYDLPARSLTVQQLLLLSTSDVSEYTTPDQMDTMWRANVREIYPNLRTTSDRAIKLCSDADAWYSSYQVQDRFGRRYTVQNVYAYGSDELYVLQYRRVASSPEDPAASKALRSLCPPQSTNPVE